MAYYKLITGSLLQLMVITHENNISVLQTHNKNVGIMHNFKTVYQQARGMVEEESLVASVMSC